MTFPPVYILRHGQTLWNAEHRFQGSLDSALTPLGRAQAAQQRDILSTCDLAGFTAFSSPQGRALETAAIALEGLIAPVRSDARLREIGIGAWEGRKRQEVAPDGTSDESEESALPLYEKAPQGEGFAAVRRRVAAFLAELPGPAVLVTHGVTSRLLRLELLDLPTDKIADLPGGQGVVYHLADGVQTKLTKGA